MTNLSDTNAPTPQAEIDALEADRDLQPITKALKNYNLIILAMINNLEARFQVLANEGNDYAEEGIKTIESIKRSLDLIPLHLVHNDTATENFVSYFSNKA